ncbi:response regulator [Desulfopila aestuarii]|uniref:response regulator n=1 Tax=Desulfopila aestuarii TaxID=231440 RepID=UPI001161187B|nr:response regulator [Desulfopila aestuarii]
MSLIESEIDKLQKKTVDLKSTNAKLKKRIKALESALEKAEQNSRVKSEFLENMSHEIRTSMNGIVGMTSLVLETKLTSEQQQYLEMVNTSVDRLQEVVSEVLDYSKIEAGLLDLEPQDFNLKESLDHDLYLLRLAAEQKGITLTCKVDPDVPESVYGDPKRLVQVLTNLVNNAIRHTESGGVSIFVKNDGYDDSNRLSLHFSVHDTGTGIDLEKQQRIFQAFSQPGSRQTASAEGIGVGLTICSQLVKMMGGELGLASSRKGSTFWFSVPFREVVDIDLEFEMDQLAAEREARTSTYALQGARVLLAEDDPINRLLTETLLTQAGVEVTSVENGEEASRLAEVNDYQIILMDVQMPVVDGLEATRKIRQVEKKSGKRRTTIIALTALAMQGDREKCLQAGMDDYISKPIEKKQLLNMLTTYLTSSALVVDGDVESKQQLVQCLVENGWNVTIAESGRSAMYEASLNPFDLILLDTRMPQMGGIEAAKVIRRLEEYSGRHAHIVGIGWGGSGEEQRCLENGIDGYIARPFTREKITERLKQLRV